MADTNVISDLAPASAKTAKSADRSTTSSFARCRLRRRATACITTTARTRCAASVCASRPPVPRPSCSTTRFAGRERRLTIGAYPDWSVAAAREQARSLRRKIDSGEDPLAAKEAERGAATVSALCDRYLSDHAARKRTGKQDQAYIDRFIRPKLGARKAESITFTDLDTLHRKLTDASGPYAANRVASLVSKMFALSIRWGMRTDNPAKGIERNHEEKRYRYLTGEELRRLTDALAACPNQTAANAVRLLLLTGARRGEVLGATWDQFSFEAGIWI